MAVGASAAATAAAGASSGAKRRRRRLLVVTVANGNCGVDDFVVLNVTPDTTTANVMHKVRRAIITTTRSIYRNKHDTIFYEDTAWN